LENNSLHQNEISLGAFHYGNHVLLERLQQKNKTNNIYSDKSLSFVGCFAVNK